MRSPLLSKIPGIAHGFGGRRANVPEPFDGPVWGPWEQTRRRATQVHGVASAELKARGQTCDEADAFWTRTPEVPAGVMTADCVPVLLAHEEGRAVAAVHAGWRGTRARILEALWRELSAALPPELARPEAWVAAIGPSIGPCCYQVSEELARDFVAEFPGSVPRERMLDLQAVNRSQLEGLGIRRVDVVAPCTRCCLEVDGGFAFHSYRREGGGTRQWSAIGIRGR